MTKKMFTIFSISFLFSSLSWATSIHTFANGCTRTCSGEWQQQSNGNWACVSWNDPTPAGPLICNNSTKSLPQTCPKPSLRPAYDPKTGNEICGK